MKSKKPEKTIRVIGGLLIIGKTCLYLVSYAIEHVREHRFPLKDESKRVYEENCDLSEEEPFLINPLEEDPEQCIYYEEIKEDQFMVKAVGRCERAERTVKELTGINHTYVMLRRADKLKDYRGWACLKNNGDDESIRSEADERLREYVSPCSEFSGFARFYFNKEGCL